MCVSIMPLVFVWHLVGSYRYISRWCSSPLTAFELHTVSASFSTTFRAIVRF